MRRAFTWQAGVLLLLSQVSKTWSLSIHEYKISKLHLLLLGKGFFLKLLVKNQKSVIVEEVQLQCSWDKLSFWYGLRQLSCILHLASNVLTIFVVFTEGWKVLMTKHLSPFPSSWSLELNVQASLCYICHVACFILWTELLILVVERWCRPKGGPQRLQSQLWMGTSAQSLWGPGPQVKVPSSSLCPALADLVWHVFCSSKV